MYEWESEEPVVYNRPPRQHGYSTQNFWKEAKRLSADWYADNEGMGLMEYLDQYTPENLCNEETFEIIYPDGLTAQQVEAQLLFDLQEENGKDT